MVYRLRKKNALAPISDFWGENYGAFPRVITTRLLTTGLNPTNFNSIWATVRNRITGGISFRDEPVYPSELGEVEVKAPPYGKIAVGTGAGSVATGVGAYFIPAPLPVKVLMGVISTALAGGTIYSIKKHKEIQEIKLQQDKIDKLSRVGLNWLSREIDMGDMIRNAISGRTPDERQRKAQIVSYIKYNLNSELVKFKSYSESSGITDEAGNGEETAVYPDFVDINKITVGKKDWNEWANDLKDKIAKINYELYKVFKIRKGVTVPYWSGHEYDHLKQTPPGLHISQCLSRNKWLVKGKKNDYGLNSNDCIFNFKGGYNIVSCGSNILSCLRPAYFHYNLYDRHYFVNINNYDDVKRKIDDIPDRAVIIGSRFVNWYLDGLFDEIKETWNKYNWITYSDVENAINQYYDLYVNKLSVSDLIVDSELELFFLTLRPDLSFLSFPAIPARLTGDYKINPNLIITSNSFLPCFIQSQLFQPFDLNFNYLIMDKRSFESFLENVVFEGIELRDQSFVSALLKIGAIVLSVVSAIVASVASYGTASIPAWAGAVSVICTVLATGMSMASKYLEQGMSEFVGGIPQMISNMWTGIKGTLNDLNTQIDTHFNNSAVAFLNGIKEFTGQIIEHTEPYVEIIKNSLKDIALDLRDNYEYLNYAITSLIPSMPSLDYNLASRLEQYIISATQTTNGMFMEAKARAESDIISKIQEVDSNLYVNDVRKLDILY